MAKQLAVGRQVMVERSVTVAEEPDNLTQAVLTRDSDSEVAVRMMKTVAVPSVTIVEMR
jgi:hypothetical protein